MMKPLHILALPILALACELALAQQLSLFETLDTVSEVPAGRPMPVQAPPAFQTPAGFTLQSLSRFGDEYRAVLRDANGNPVKVAWSAGEQIALPGYAGIAVLGAEEGAGLLLQQPVPCMPNEQQGISCVSANVARLSLAMQPPITAQAPQQQAAAGPAPQPQFRSRGRRGEVLVDNNGNTLMLNGPAGEAIDPQQLQALLNARAQSMQQRFGGVAIEAEQVEFVSGEEVPAGMRVVRTRFGDRLVPVRD